MKHYLILIAGVLLVQLAVRADMLPPAVATAAISPNGKTVVRVRGGEVFRYDLNTETNAFTLAKRFKLRDPSPQFIYVSNHGDVVCLSLSETGAIDLFNPEGASQRKWSLSDFLSKDQIRDCPQTGATTQWFDEAKFYDREFVFRGPSQRVRRVPSSYTLMRRGDPNEVFAFVLDCKAVTLTEYRDEDSTEPSDPSKDRASGVSNGKSTPSPR